MLYVIYILFGVILGLISGLLVGLHPNNIIPFIYWEIDDNYLLAAIIVSLSVSFSIFSFLSVIFFNFGDLDTFVSLDIYRRLYYVYGIKYFFLLTVLGGILSVFPTIMLYTLLSSYIVNIYEISISYLPIFLIFTSTIVILKSKNILHSLLFFIISGILGFLSLNQPIPSYAKLSALLTGLFGAPYLILDIISKTKPNNAESNNKNYKITSNKVFDNNILSGIVLLKSILVGVLSSLIVLFIPSLTPIHGFILIALLLSLSPVETLISLGALNTSDQIFSLLFVQSIGNPRSGPAFFYNLLNINDTIFLISTVFLSLAVSSILSLYIVKHIENSRIIYRLILSKTYKLFVLILLVVIMYVFGGVYSLLIFLTSMSLGYLSMFFYVNRIVLTGSIILPVLLSFTL